MAFVEGGAFKCSKHDFETESIKEWNGHCLEYPDDHYETGSTICSNCGESVDFDHLPYHPINERTGSKDISLRCEECDTKIMGTVKRTTVKRGNPNQ